MSRKKTPQPCDIGARVIRIDSRNFKDVVKDGVYVVEGVHWDMGLWWFKLKGCRGTYSAKYFKVQLPTRLKVDEKLFEL